MRSVTLQTVAIVIAVLCSAERASACSVVIPRERGSSEFRKMAMDAVDNATAIIDGEVLQPFIEGKQNAVVRAVHVLQGSDKTLFVVGER
ncbi:MAG: hypothetical protein EOO77_37975 [Oxalobacteraceae bacterium]|nr:MAG: hypothetical protein EOO77_37975 [Oxalobacteraceae bacterium]